MAEAVLAVEIARRALDGLSMRMEAIAQNVANSGSTTYRPVRVEFEKVLAQAVREGPDGVRSAVFTFTAGPVQGAGNDRRTDLELADAGVAASRYALVADALGRRMALMRSAAGLSQ